MSTLQIQNHGTHDHPVFGPVAYSVEDIGVDPDAQVARTLGIMGQRTREDALDPGFITWAERVTGCTPGQCADLDVIDRAYQHVKGALRFQRDETTGAGVGNYPLGEVVEIIIRPREMAKFVQMGVGTGDCDDYSMYLAGILTVFGIPVEFCTVAADARAPGNYSHVYVVAYPNDANGRNRTRVALDASHGEYPGWEVPNMFGRRKQWPVATVGNWTELIGVAAVLALLFLGGGR